MLSLSLKLGLFPGNYVQKDKFSFAKHEFLDGDCFNRISEWYFDAILELSKVKKFDFSQKNISQYLGINEVKVASAIDTLLRLKLLKKTKRGLEIVHANSTNLLSDDTTSAATRSYQKSILEKSVEALELVDRSDRDHSSTTLAIKKSDLSKAKKIIKDFHYKLSALLQENNKEFDEVYQLQISLFPHRKKRQ